MTTFETLLRNQEHNNYAIRLIAMSPSLLLQDNNYPSDGKLTGGDRVGCDRFGH